MSLTRNVKLVTGEYAITVTEAAASEVGDGAAEALALTEGAAELGDWTYSATAEGRTGEVAGDGGFDLDGEPGLIYEGVTGAAVNVRLTALVVDEGSGGAEVTDKVAVGLMRNNDIVALSDEGFEAHAATSQNFNTYVSLTEGDVLRVALITPEGNETDADYDVTPADLVIV